MMDEPGVCMKHLISQEHLNMEVRCGEHEEVT